jgi:phosphonate transport system substrate-binding protein
VAAASSNFKAFFDPKTNKNTVKTAAEALKQFDGKKPCYVDPLSASGYVIPSGIVAKSGVKTAEPVFAGGHPQVILALYNGGTCDFGVTYIDARTAKDFAEKKDVNDKVVVIYRTDPIIPNDNVSFAASLPKDMQTKLKDALVKLASTKEGVDLLKGGGYQVESLKAVDDTFYDELRVYLQATGLDITKLVK